MAEALAVIGLVSNIISFVDFGQKIVKRLKDFQSQANEVPKSFREIMTELPLLLNTLNATKEQAEADLLDVETQKTLFPVVDGCRSEVRELEDILRKVLPASTDHTWEVRRKAIVSIHQEKKVRAISDTLQRYMQILTYHEATQINRLDLREYLHRTRSRSPRPNARTVMDVPFERDLGYIDRAGIIQDVEESLRLHRRCSLAGIGGVG